MTAVFVMVGNSAVPATRGTVNGIGQSMVAMLRGTAPVIGALLFAWSERNGTGSSFEVLKLASSSPSLALLLVFLLFLLLLLFYPSSPLPPPPLPPPPSPPPLPGLSWPLNYHLVFDMCAILSVLIIVFSLLMPGTIEKKRDSYM